ncbi:hypothetical protein JTE90_025529 [Oedothorax gibbosus]|uniref:Uncharacterized protein n=1 Tax=Oedothorax gibbosus TaxID=931172 RepID=A0AAV6TXK2_9ARAC|nr:hypothetical protein JTE90_025529 [Oedothorax gibbosus]
MIEGHPQVRYTTNDNVILRRQEPNYTVTRKDLKTHEETIFTVIDRSDEKMKDDMIAAFNTSSVVNGIKGISPLMNLSYVGLVSAFTIDYMHCVLLGVVKKVTHLWLDSTSHDKPYYIGKKTSDVDNRLTKIKPPTYISRRPRSIVDRAYWKANEFRSWLLHYSLPCLAGILPYVFLKHHCMLATAIFMLLQQDVSSDIIETASWYLAQYVLEFQNLYGELNMNFNLHLLLHLGKCVEKYGPL